MNVLIDIRPGVVNAATFENAVCRCINLVIMLTVDNREAVVTMMLHGRELVGRLICPTHALQVGDKVAGLECLWVGQSHVELSPGAADRIRAWLVEIGVRR